MTEPERNRLILELCQGASDPTTIRAAAEYARMLGLDLHCLFIEDEALIAWSDTAFAREIRVPTYRWSPVSAETVSLDLRHAAAATQRRLRQTLPGDAGQHHFEVLRGDPATCIAGVCRGGDVVVVTEPAVPGLRATIGSSRLRSGASASAASVLLLPARPAPASGGIAVLLDDAADDSLDVACRMALGAGEKLLVLLPADFGDTARARVAARVRQAGIAAGRVSMRAVPHRATPDVLLAAGGTRLRLIVLTRRDEADESNLAPELVSTASIPVLVVEPVPRTA